MITILSGGRGTPKLIEGLRRLIDDSKMTVIVNTADDFWWNDLYISPDLDTVVYLFSNLLDTSKYWGVKNDTFNFLNQARKYGIHWDWFNIGDKDLAMHIIRTNMLRRGYNLTEITKYICKKLGIKAKIYPMSNDKVDTYVYTDIGKIHIQEFLVKYKADLKVEGIVFEGLDDARPPSEVINSIVNSKLILIGPSNPINSIGPIININEIKSSIAKSNAIRIAVSPIISGRPVSGPADKFMRACGYEPSPIGLAEVYRGLIDVLVIDNLDKRYADILSNRYNISTYTTNILMNTDDDKLRLAAEILKIANM